MINAVACSHLLYRLHLTRDKSPRALRSINSLRMTWTIASLESGGGALQASSACPIAFDIIHVWVCDCLEVHQLVLFPVMLWIAGS